MGSDLAENVPANNLTGNKADIKKFSVMMLDSKMFIQKSSHYDGRYQNDLYTWS